MEKYKIEIKRSAAKEIESLPRKDILAVMHRIGQMADDSRPRNCLKILPGSCYSAAVKLREMGGE